MSNSEQIVSEPQPLHRKDCSNRVFIGPWDITTPQDFRENFQTSQRDHNSIESASLAQKTISSSKFSTTAINQPSPPTTDHFPTPSSEGTSFLTARTSTQYQDANSRYLQNSHSRTDASILEDQEEVDDDEDEDIDYDLLMSNNLSIGTSMQVTNDAESSKTIRPSASKSDPTYDKKGKSPMRKLSMMKKSKSNHHRLSVFSQQPQQHEDNTTNRPRQPLQSINLKREPMLCMRSVTGCTGTGPTQYNAVKETKFDLMAEKWRQVELVLTNSYISTYSASTMFWPKYRLEHRIYLIGPKRPQLLSLFLLSSLDYTFCLRYTSTVKKEPMIVTLTFKARSFLKCQEWYMQLYHMLPHECKHPPPQWCDVYIPLLDLVVNLPLAHLQDSSRITIEEVKEAVISIVQEEQEELVQQTAAINTQAHSLQHFGFCWTAGDRAEWIYWTHSASGQRMDSVICPQNIEKTHRLEFRPIEHTPRDIELSDQFSLKEPPPVEGFLMHITDFAGSTKQGSKQKMRYFASFDQYLFYIPTSKVPVPNMRCFINDDLLPRNIRVQPYISAISPYTPACTPEIEAEEISRRMQLMIEAKGVIDLTEVLQVKRSFIEPTSPGPFRRFSQTQRTLGESSISDQSRIGLLSKQLSKGGYQAINQEDTPSNDRRACLELVMENGLHIQLEAYSSETCDLWVRYLAQIIVYWKARKEAEREAHSSDNFVYKVDSKEFSKHTKSSIEDGCLHIKQKLADTRIWSHCLYEQCRDVVKSGVLYYKPYKRGSYTQKMFILTSSGWLLFYDVYNRDASKPRCDHRKKNVLDIAGCYIYSGLGDSKKHKGSNRDDLLRKSARIYKNGLSTDDDSLSCIFSIWKPKLRRYFSTRKHRLSVYHHDKRINSDGETWSFLAPSRRAKEEWVYTLNTVIEHMIRSETRRL